MTTHLKRDATSGHLVYGSGGHLVHTCENPCAYCSGSTPSTLTAILSGISLCSGCIKTLREPPAYLSAKIIVSPSVGPNGTFVLTQETPLYYLCQWSYQQSCAGTIRFYENEDCTGDSSDGDITSFGVRINVTSLGWSATAYYDALLDYFTSDRISVGIDCSGGSFTTNLSSCSNDGETGESGSITFAP